jgi:hypothetical protein
MSAWTYADDGSRHVFDPQITSARLDGCLLCGRRRIASVGIFVPATDEMRVVVLRLRQHALKERSTGALAYGLCAACVEDEDVIARVEQAIEAAAAKVIVQ